MSETATTSVYVWADDGPWDLRVSADVAQLREHYGAELRDDGLYDASDEAIVKHVYEQNPDAVELTVESDW